MRLKIILSFLTLLSLAFLVPSDVFGAWYDTEWEYRNKITVSLNSVISNDLSDFPVLIKFTHNDLKQANESEGRDFVFTLSDGTTKLSHEIESYDNATGEIIAWVNFPTLAAASSADIYIYYKGNTVGFNSADVWNDDYVLVWHLNQTSDGTAGEFSDATGNGNDGRGGGGTKVGYSAGRIPHDTDGQIGAGQELKGPTTIGSGEGTGDIIWTNSVIQGMPSRDVTIELWVGDIVNGPDNENNWLYNDLVSFCTTHTNDANNKWSNHLNLWRSGNVKMQAVTDLYVSTTDPGHPVDNNNPASFTNWNHIVAVYNLKDADGTQGNSQLYINGVLVKEENRSGHLNRVIQTSDLRMVLGGDVDGINGNNCAKVNNELKGKVDELRISSGLKTADYAAATYFNQGDPSTYLSLGTQETQETQDEEIEEKKGSDCYDCEIPKLTKVEVHITSNTSEAGGKDSCNSNGFGNNKSLRVYQVSYDINSYEVQVQAYSTCGSISVKITTPSERSILGLSMDQPYLDDRVAVYFGYLDESDEKFNISIQNKRDSFDETFYIYDKSIIKKYTGETGYTSEQQDSFSPIIPSTQITIASEPSIITASQTIKESIPVEKQIVTKKSVIDQTQSIQYTPEPIAEETTESTCGIGTESVNGICKIIIPDEPQFCFLFWCW